ncbi:hypothetical protein C8R42DRAFT_729736 [Lentinula raphanica]|nr:hypothetical protein C8R42DRAFT_729736 [Lentinula raphanica]
MNLADPKHLSVPGLEGLARLLELLTNYFKVEIGHKLLDRFHFVADPSVGEGWVTDPRPDPTQPSARVIEGQGSGVSDPTRPSPTLADPQMLQASSRSPLGENEGITKLVRLANIFHLLPTAANIFLNNLVNAIVQKEAQMHFSSQKSFLQTTGQISG